jgi:hypothetical protein
VSRSNRPKPSHDMIMLAKAIRQELSKAGYSQQDVINFANQILELVADELRSGHSTAPPPSLS